MCQIQQHIFLPALKYFLRIESIFHQIIYYKINQNAWLKIKHLYSLAIFIILIK